ncbi:hypothetical protein DEO72_LG7g2879 [Vigna unguiculata]|uniref:Uncharacterized protein n=1 Tax=Vigna unguiculata TaxID=3917 RepID=A0A4D6MJ51_VIGUN|nr:hypothetical protein DEO72_LG7g2879 [Vigna unguiculata]
MIVESYGFIILFSGFWPTLAVFLQKIPVLGCCLIAIEASECPCKTGIYGNIM